MINNNPPSLNPTNLDNLTGTLKEILKKYSQWIEGMIPAQVVNFNRNANTVTVQPTINILTENDQSILRKPIPG